MTILRDPKLLADASTADLLETYNAMTGESVKRFSTRDAGIRRCEMALLAAADAAGHAGVPKGRKPTPETKAELERRKPGSTKPAEPAEAERVSDEPMPPLQPIPVEEKRPIPKTHKPGSLAAKLAEVAQRHTPITPREKAAKKERAPGTEKRHGNIVSVKQRLDGVSKMHAASERRAVWGVLNPRVDVKIEDVLARAQADIRADFTLPQLRGYLQKLAEKDWAELTYSAAQG